MSKVLITGTAGFIGFHLANALLRLGEEVVGLDNINDYYSPDLKFARLAEAGFNRESAEEWYTEVRSEKYKKYRFIRMNLEDKDQLLELCEKEKFDIIINLAAQAGVRYSIENPDAYVQSNIIGFVNILEACRYTKIKHLIYASSSSVYGKNTKLPFSIKDNVDQPVSMYAATKKANELMAHTYSHLFNIPTTGLRFFTVYGPWGRPDMAYFLFAEAIRKEEPIKVFNHGKLRRDFTYIDDIVQGIVNISKQPAESSEPDLIGSSHSTAPYKIYNIGNNQTVELMDFITTIGEVMGKTPEMIMLDMQPGDVPATWANVDELSEKFNYKPNTPIAEGLKKFGVWYKEHYQ